MCVADRAPVLTLRLQMTEISHSEHGFVGEIHASVHCQHVGMLTDDAPDSSSPLSTPPLLRRSHTFRQRRPQPTHSSTEHGGGGGGISETHSQIIHRAPLLNM